MHVDHLGPYRLVKRIGKGGMGAVYEAVHQQTGAVVAIKALSPQLAMVEGFRERFEAEIESLKVLEHESIVRLFGFGEDRGILFYSMELVEGSSLEEEISAGRRFDWLEVLAIAIQVCRALKHAHDHGVIHRDIKPANLLLRPDNRVKIADFGIARFFGSTQLTNVGGVLGTADYMSPEQADGRSVTEKCDQYSLGSVMYALLAGRPPFRAKTIPEMLQLQRFAEPDPIRRYAPDAPVQLEQLISQLLSKDPDGRFPNIMVLARHMEAMRKALSRPTPPQSVRQDELPQLTRNSGMGETEATSAGALDMTMAARDSELTPLETSDSYVHDAPTLAESQQGVPSTARNTQLQRESSVDSPTSRFTTVDEEARLRKSNDGWDDLALWAKLAGLSAILAVLVALVWRMTRPASSDDLYRQITAAAGEGNASLQSVEGKLKEFADRFPGDPRKAEIDGLLEDLRLSRLEHRLRTPARATETEQELLAPQIYAAALDRASSDPQGARKLLEQLLALYGEEAPAQGTDFSEPTGVATDPSDERSWLALARRQLQQWENEATKRAAAQIPQIAERIKQARAWEESAPKRAAAVYRALIDMFGDDAWAAELVEQARQGMERIGP